MIEGGSGLTDGVLGTLFVSAHRRKLGVSKGYIGRTLVGLAGRETYLSVMSQADKIFDGKEPVEVRRGGVGAATIMEFRTM